MVRSTTVVASCLAALVSFAPCAASAQLNQSAVARLKALSGFVGDAAWCGYMGFDQLPGGAGGYGEAAVAEAILGGVPREEAEHISIEAIAASQSRMEAETKDLTALASETPNKLRAGILTFATAKAAACHKMAADPVGRHLLKAPPYSVAKSALMFSDPLLEPAGVASWQTDYIRAGGDVSRAIGYCAHILTAEEIARYRALVMNPGKIAADARPMAKAWFDLLQDQSERSGGEFDETQCKRLMASNLADLKAVK